MQTMELARSVICLEHDGSQPVVLRLLSRQLIGLVAQRPLRTPREDQVWLLLQQGYTKARMARELPLSNTTQGDQVSESTVQTHIDSIARKFGVSRGELSALAIALTKAGAALAIPEWMVPGISD
jgi:DNA-binding NarL/FixJ family response regulator